jgi:Xaa-Pro aminopeptidase
VSVARGRYAWFTEAELARRTRALAAALETADVAAAVLIDPLNVTYFSGHVTPGYVLRSRPVGMVVTREGDATLVIARQHVPQAEAATWLEDLVEFDGLEAEFVVALRTLLADQVPAGGRIGYEGSAEQRPGMTVDGFLALRSGGQEWTDVAPLVWGLRQVKSDAEVDYLRTVGRATGAAFDAVRDRLRPGLTEEQLYQVFAAHLAEDCGGSVGYFAMHSGPDERFRTSGWPTERVIAKGDLVWLDVGATYRGYWSDFTRMYAVGAVTETQQRSYRLMYDVNRYLLGRLRPGQTAEGIVALAREWFAEHDVAVANAARIGHGLGTSITEQPSVMSGDPTVLVPGMALAIEPAIRTTEGYFVVEENVLVTDRGTELLSVPNPSELTVV